MGPGRKVIARVWERPTLALELCSVLADLNWGGFKFLALPAVVKGVPDLLDAYTEKALQLLGTLQVEKRLQVDNAWKQKLQSWFSQRLAGWTGASEQVRVRTRYSMHILSSIDSGSDSASCHLTVRPPTVSWFCSCWNRQFHARHKQRESRF